MQVPRRDSRRKSPRYRESIAGTAMGLTKKVPSLVFFTRVLRRDLRRKSLAPLRVKQVLQWDLRRKSHLSFLPPHPTINLREHPPVEMLVLVNTFRDCLPVLGVLLLPDVLFAKRPTASRLFRDCTETALRLLRGILGIFFTFSRLISPSHCAFRAYF